MNYINAIIIPTVDEPLLIFFVNDPARVIGFGGKNMHLKTRFFELPGHVGQTILWCTSFWRVVLGKDDDFQLLSSM